MSAPTEAKPPATPATPAPPPAKAKGGAGSLLLGAVLPALLAAAGGYGGAHSVKGAPAAAHAEEAPHPEFRAPGPTMPLEPFLVSVPDANKRNHPMKLTLAVEFDTTTKEETLKALTPRIRDAVLAHMRTLTFEEAVDQQHSDKLRAEILDRCHRAGALAAERILITDLVSQ